MLTKIKFFVLISAFSIGGGFFLLKKMSFESDTILIESEESKTQNLTSVFNQIKWISTPKHDIWMMNQSHFGINAPKEKWERLAIVIDKTKTPMTARYYQLSPGPLKWSDDMVNQREPYRASCFTCHSNGPRAIRPQFINAQLKMSVSEKAKIALWNLKIKTYGRIHYDKIHNQEDVKLSTPFHYSAKSENDELKVASCIRCHKEDGYFARGALVRQQAGTIQRMVENGHMPPPGFSLSDGEKKRLRDFLRGF